MGLYTEVFGKPYSGFGGHSIVFYIIKKISRGGGVSSSRIKIKNRLYLDNKRYLAVIEVDGREFLIGASDSINILMELKNDDKED